MKYLIVMEYRSESGESYFDKICNYPTLEDAKEALKYLLANQYKGYKLTIVEAVQC